MRAETGGGGSSGVCYTFGPRAVFRLAERRGGAQRENKEENADATSKREEVKENRWKDREHKNI